MKKELTLDGKALAPRRSVADNLFSSKNAFRSLLERTAPVVALSRLYSRLMQEPVSADLALRLVHAQVACMALLGCVADNLLLTLFLLLWAAWAVNRCRKAIKS